jgi:hypothetical protein
MLPRACQQPFGLFLKGSRTFSGAIVGAAAAVSAENPSHDQRALTSNARACARAETRQVRSPQDKT